MEHDFYSFSKAVGKKVSSVVCEVEGILLGIERAIQFFQGSQTHRNTEYVYIFSDCTTAIDTVVNMNQCHHFPDLLHRLYALMNQLHFISIKFVSIPAHSGIFGNEVADKEAKCVAHKISIGIISAPDIISIKDTYRIAANIAKKSWQRKWNEDNTGRYTHNLIPYVGTKVSFPLSRDKGISYCRMLLHDTMLNDDSYRTGTSVTPLCECGLERETVEHFLLRCNKYDEARNILMDSIKDIWISSEIKVSK